MDPTRGWGTSGTACTGHGPRGPRPVRLRSPRLCSGYAWRGGGRGNCGTAFPCPVRTDREGCDTVPPAPPLRMQGGSGCGPPSHLGVGRLGKRQDGRASHPESVLDEGPAIFLPDLWREGAFQRLPPSTHVCKKRKPAKPLPRPGLHRGFTPWLTRQGSVEASTRGGADTSLIAQKLNGRLASVNPLRMAVRVRLSVIPSADEALRDLGTFAFVASHLFSAGRRHLSAVNKLLRLIERLEELHTEVQGMI